MEDDERRDALRPGRRLQPLERRRHPRRAPRRARHSAEYREPLRNTYWNESLADLPDAYEIDVLAEDTCLVGLRVVLANGGSVAAQGGSLVLEIPDQQPQPPARLEQIKWRGDTPVVE